MTSVPLGAKLKGLATVADKIKESQKTFFIGQKVSHTQKTGDCFIVGSRNDESSPLVLLEIPNGQEGWSARTGSEVLELENLAEWIPMHDTKKASFWWAEIDQISPIETTAKEIKARLADRIKAIETEKKQKADETKRENEKRKRALDSVIMPAESKNEIESVLNQQKSSKKIFEEWGLGDVIKYGKGMTFLFYGVPGTGKTATAHAIAEYMGKELRIMTTAETQSSEPGYTQRCITQVFEECTKQDKVLLLDECDSFITTRSDVGMILGSEINTLLTEIEKFEGVCILTTNRIDSLDEALERRLSLILEYKEPEYHDRVSIWQRLLPKKFPLESDVLPGVLAEYPLTGGQIKNAVLSTARLTASAGHKKAKLDTFKHCIEKIRATKNLMGQSSRWRQVKVQSDIGVSKVSDIVGNNES